MPPRMVPDAGGGYAPDEVPDMDDDATLPTNPLEQPLHAPLGPFHPSLRRRGNKAAASTPRWGTLAVMALALLALEASILLGVTDLRRMWAGGQSGDRGGAGESSCHASPAAAWEEEGGGGGGAGAFAGLKQWVGEQQEGAALWGRYHAVVDEFEGYLEERERAGAGGKAKGWTLLSSSKDGRYRVSLRWPDANNPGKGAPMLIAEGLYWNTTAEALWEAMRCRSTLRTMPQLDPFFEDYVQFKTYSPHAELGRRTTKRLLVFGKRDFLQGAVEEEGRRRKKRWRGLGFGVEGKGFSQHPREWVAASLSVPEAVQRDPQGQFFAMARDRPGYTRGFQDLVGFYTPVPSPHPSTMPAAAATIIMRTDLRGHIPHWIFSKTAGPTGMHLLMTLQKMTGASDRPPQS